jgi:thioredoxin-related protein
MNTLAFVKGVLAAIPLMMAPHSIAQPDKPVHPATPAFEPRPARPAKPVLYDENADAKQQIAAAVARAKRENRRVLLQWGGNWCGWCIKLDELCKSDPDLRKKLLYEYDVVHVDAGRDNKNMDLAKSHGAACATEGFPYLTILDSTGKAIANQGTPAFEVDPQSLTAGHDPKKLLKFLTEHQAPYLDARALLDAGVAQAKQEGKRVFLHFGAPWCVWCHRLEDWMARPEVATILSKEFVDVKVDIDRTQGGTEIKTRYAGAADGGIPWFVFLDGSGKALADSGGPKTNLGFPYAQEEVDRFTEMLRKTAAKLTPGEIDALAKSLHANREAAERNKPQTSR